MTLERIAAESRDWLFEAAAPLWAASPGSPLFPERISLSGERDVNCPHRLFVQARHVFSFCELGRLGWTGPWRAMVSANVDFLLRAGRRDDGFYVHSFDPVGHVLDARADLYDQAFILLALAHAGEALGAPELFSVAGALANPLQARWRLPHGGYCEGEIAVCPPYRQNPHMHLLEAFIALHSRTGDGRWRDRAEEIASLCARRFLDLGTGALLEYFDDRFCPLPGEEGRKVEPGHCFEWAWLFEKLSEWGFTGAAELSGRLTAFARSNGISHDRGVAINEVLVDGSVVNPDARLWPQTERLKAALARYGRTRSAREREEALAAYAGLTRYFNTPKRGVWRDKLSSRGTWVEEPAPGSSLYHITCALAQLVDLGSLLRQS